MSTVKKAGRLRAVEQPVITPLIGSLLRLPHEVMVGRIFESVQAHGFQVTLTELRVFLFPGPDGLRPAELSRRCNMTRQAMNYVLASLENQDLIERRDGPDLATRVVHLTDRGWRLIGQIRECVATVEGEWAALLGKRRMEDLRQTLHELSVQLGKIDR
ncbi:MarR family transcriptional regulator [Variovorax robiniae]|uniref:MarR family transcriptional regulator n=1 Tax=Variovorax robiniae TaxID=1836199 RepID=A0ABU8XIX8_9BURK